MQFGDLMTICYQSICILFELWGMYLDCQYSLWLLQVYSSPATVQNCITWQSDYLCVRLFYSVNIPLASNMDMNICVTLHYMWCLMKSNINWSIPFADLHWQHIFWCACCSELMAWETIEVKSSQVNNDLMQLSGSYTIYLIYASSKICNISKTLRPNHATQLCHYIIFPSLLQAICHSW
jgi:hypothetical protein